MTNEQYYELIKPYEDASRVLSTRLEILNHSLYGDRSDAGPIHNIQGRIKEKKSMESKLVRLGFTAGVTNARNHLQDIAGLRIICYFVEDIYNLTAALKKEIGQLNQKMMVLKADDMVNHAEAVNGLNIILEKVSGLDGQAMKNLAETLRNKCEKSFIFLANPSEGKVTYVCACSKEAIAKGIKAGDFVKMAAQMSQGNGGGRPDMAQSGGKDGSKVDEVFALIRSKL